MIPTFSEPDIIEKKGAESPPTPLPHLFNEKLMKIGRLMGAKDFAIAGARK